MADQPKPPRGRGAVLLAALQKAQAAQQVGTPSEAPAANDGPPKPKGRAAMLQRLAEMKQTRAGPSTSSGDATSMTTKSQEIPPSVTPSVTSITKSMSSTQISEPCLYSGSGGKSVNISCNYIKLSAEADKGVFEYCVKFSPEIDAKSVRGRLVYNNAGPIKMFDGGSCLYLPTKLPDVTTIYNCVHPINESAVEMSFTFIKHKRLGDCIHLFNILFKRIMHALLLSPIGRNYYDPNHTHMIPQHRLEVLPGYAVAVDEYEGGVMVCLDTQHRVMRTISVLDVLKDLHSMVRDRFKEAATKALIGASVLTRYNNKTYRVDDILWNASPANTFETHDGKSISYVDYYKNHYGIEIKDLKQPLLLNMQTKKSSQSSQKVEQVVCLIPELCFMTGLTDEMRSDFKVMKDVAMYTRVTPNQRMSALRTYLDNINKTPEAKKILENWGFKIEKGTIDLLARILDPETITFGQGVVGHSQMADWNNLVCRNKVLGPIDLINWYVVYTFRDEKIAEEFVNTTMRLSDTMGMRIEKPKKKLLKDDRTDSYLDMIKSIVAPQVQILVFICPTSRTDRYSSIKRVCCHQLPIPTQVINSRTLSDPKKSRAVTQKVALQINCKIGGTLWSLRFPCKNWMVCGIDIYHSPGSKTSVCAFISSLNSSFTRWYSNVIFQKKELIDELKMSLAKALEVYRETNGVFPSNIVIFRDGVGDGQLNYCKEYEVAQFEQCLQDYQLVETKLTMVVVQKRINTRLFLNKGRGDLENPPPGTILDHTITRRNWYDFFLVAQNVRQGTVTPTHYIVVHDSAKLKPDHVQKLAYKLCHLYYNWPGTIRVPAPCQYAHKLAYLVGQHICKPPSTTLCDRLYYL